MSETLREKVAKAMFPAFEENKPQAQGYCLELADAAIAAMREEAKAMEQKANCCKLCGAPFSNINGMSSTNCNCARERSTELAEAQKKWDESKLSTSMQGEAKEKGWMPGAAPPVGESVLLTLRDGSLKIGRRMNGGIPVDYDCIAWRPLPPPYVPPRPKLSAEEQLRQITTRLDQELAASAGSDLKLAAALERIRNCMDRIADGEEVL